MGFRIAALHNAPRAYIEWRGRQPVVDVSRFPNVPLARIVRTKAVQHIPDLTADQAYIERTPPIVALVEAAGARSLLSVPMLKEGDVIGAIVIYRQEVRPFTDKQIELMQNFAAQAVIAIENTRLLNELRESLQQQTATSEVLRRHHPVAGELEPVFEAMLANATRICEAKIRQLVPVRRRRVSAPSHCTTRRRPMAEDRAARARSARQPDTGPWPHVARTKQIAHIADFGRNRHTSSAIQRRRQRRPAGARTLLIVPMLKENELIGTIAIYRRRSARSPTSRSSW